MANSAGLCTSFKVQLLKGSHAFGAQATNSVRTVTTKDTFNLALYLASASLSVATTVYSATGELAATGNYTAKGKLLTNATEPSAAAGTTAFWTPSANVTWTALTSSGAFDAALLINNKSTDTTELAVSVHTFSSQSITAADFTLTMPTNDATTGLVRIA